MCLSQLHQNSKLAVAISREHAYASRLPSQLYCFDKEHIIYNYALTFLVRKDFRYLNELNRFVRAASAGGLIEKWQRSFRTRNVFANDMKKCIIR